MTPALLTELDAALQAVSDVLSKVDNADWDAVQPIQASINQSHELTARIRERAA